MTDLKMKNIENLLSRLHAAGVKYVVTVPTGEELTNCGSAMKRAVDPDYGLRKALADDALTGMEVGEVRSIPPLEGYTLRETSHSLSSACHQRFGKGNYMTKTRREENCVDVLLAYEEKEEADV